MFFVESPGFIIWVFNDIYKQMVLFRDVGRAANSYLPLEFCGTMISKIVHDKKVCICTRDTKNGRRARFQTTAADQLILHIDINPHTIVIIPMYF